MTERAIFRKVVTIGVGDWDWLVQKTYGKPYSFQQQDDCRPRGVYRVDISDAGEDEDYPDSIPEVINGEERGVNFKSWLARDPKEWNGEGNGEGNGSRYINMFWERSFYPVASVIAKDLFERGIIEEQSFSIDVDW